MDTGTDARRGARRRRGSPRGRTAGGPRVCAGVAGAGALLGLLSAGAQTFGLTDYSGAELYQQFCAACHGPAGQGDGPVAATLNVAVPDLTRLAERNDGRFPAADVRDIVDGRALVVAHGPRSMPVWGYEFWIEEGGDIEAEADVRELVDRLVRHIESIQAPAQRGGAIP